MLQYMKTALLLIASPLLLILGLGCVSQGVPQGTATWNFGYPLSANSIEVSIKAAGGWVVSGFVFALAAVIAYIWGLIAVLRSRTQQQHVTAAEPNN